MEIIKLKDIIKGDQNYLWEIEKNSFKNKRVHSYELFLKRINMDVAKVIIFEEEIIGGIFLEKLSKENSYRLEEIFIVPKLANKGIGTYILNEIEGIVPELKEIIIDCEIIDNKVLNYLRKNNFKMEKYDGSKEVLIKRI
ncbi:GNAT family N-acetyltransferase [Cetobacterium sp. SF1]|uniref:GNAT family N-acetyltransferase n=1 Tax=Cetobacterium sp. SF1 TaxID=3417654 RepID=UPI003CE7F149